MTAIKSAVVHSRLIDHPKLDPRTGHPPPTNTRLPAASAPYRLHDRAHRPVMIGHSPAPKADMTNLANILKGEITRLARKEVRAQLAVLRKTNAKHKQDIAALRRQLAEQQRVISTLKRSPSKASTTTQATTKARFSAKGLRALRTRLGLSAADFGRLAGVSGQSIYHWESGKTVPRDSQKVALAGLRSLGKRAALARLAAMDAKSQ